MSSWVDLEDTIVELADTLGERLHLGREEIIWLALQSMAIRWDVRIPERDEE